MSMLSTQPSSNQGTFARTISFNDNKYLIFTYQMLRVLSHPISDSRPVHGLIFLFKWKAGDEPSGPIVQDSRLDNIFFAKQVIKSIDTETAQ